MINAIEKISGNQNNRNPNPNFNAPKNSTLDKKPFEAILRDISLATVLPLSKQEQVELMRKAKVADMTQSMTQAFSLQSSQLIASNLEKFEQLSPATAYLALLGVLAEFNKKDA